MADLALDRLPPATHGILSGARRCLILANVRAGGLLDRSVTAFGAARPPLRYRSLVRLAQAVSRAGVEGRIEPIPALELLDARIRSARAEGFDTIVAAGGDGTVRAVAQRLVGTDLILGVLPLGTDNNFARALSLPIERSAAVDVLRTGIVRRVDVGCAGREIFIEGAGVGLFADALLAFGAEEPRSHQLLRLLRVLWPLCCRPTARRLVLTLDGDPVEEEALMVTAANCAYLGSHWPVAPDARLSDGLFDVVIVGALNRAELARFVLALMHGTHLSLPGVRCALASRVEIRRSLPPLRPLVVHADDHIAGRTPIELQVVPDALRVLVPALA